MDRGEHRFAISLPTRADPTLIICPKCGHKAKVMPVDDRAVSGKLFDHGKLSVRASCLACGFTRTRLAAAGRAFYWGSDNPTDSFFGFDLWLQTGCAGHSLWAFNLRHLEFLEQFAGARLRERRRDPHWRNSSLASRLPRWIQSGHNRKDLLKSIEKLKRMAG